MEAIQEIGYARSVSKGQNKEFRGIVAVVARNAKP